MKLIGRNENKDRIYVEMKWDGRRLSLMGEVIGYRCREPHAAGQIVSDVREINPRLADLWERWHLNDMRAGCEHQEESYRNGVERPTWRNDYLDWPVCEECGYKYGHGWNFEEVPEEVIDELKEILG